MDNEVKSIDESVHCLHSVAAVVLFADTYARAIEGLTVVELTFAFLDQWLRCWAPEASVLELALVVRSAVVVEALVILVEELAVGVGFEAYYNETVVVVVVLVFVAVVVQRIVVVVAVVEDIAVAVVVVAVEVFACEARLTLSWGSVEWHTSHVAVVFVVEVNLTVAEVLLWSTFVAVVEFVAEYC